MEFNDSERALLKQAASATKYQRQARFAWIGAALVLIGSVAIVTGNEGTRQSIGFAVVLLGFSISQIAFLRFRARALSLIQRLRRETPLTVNFSAPLP